MGKFQRAGGKASSAMMKILCGVSLVATSGIIYFGPRLHSTAKLLKSPWGGGGGGAEGTV